MMSAGEVVLIQLVINYDILTAHASPMLAVRKFSDLIEVNGSGLYSCCKGKGCIFVTTSVGGTCTVSKS